jgi:hypothetical protein
MQVVGRSAVVLGLLLYGPVAWAQPTPDHLQCFKIKDVATKNTYTVDLTPGNPGFPVAAGCVVKVPAKVLCIDVVKSNVTPMPPGSPAGAAAQTYLCYKTKCPKAQPTATFSDQFGSHAVQVKAMSLLCAPVAGATTTTTSTTTSSTIAGCASASQCPGTDTDCKQRTCTAGTCGFSFTPMGVPVATQTPGDCQQVVCDGAGGTTNSIDSSDVPADDGNQCTAEICVGGTPSHQNRPQGFPCSQNGGTVCDGGGTCVQCTTASQCPGTDTECQQRTCTANTCGLSFTPSGTPVATQTPGDCHQVVCDGAGGTTSNVDNSDVPADDGNQCTSETCVAGTPSHQNKPMGFPCSQSGGTHCDGGGNCVP